MWKDEPHLPRKHSLDSQKSTHLGEKGRFVFAFRVGVSIGMINTKHLLEKQELANY